MLSKPCSRLLHITSNLPRSTQIVAPLKDMWPGNSPAKREQSKGLHHISGRMVLIGGLSSCALGWYKLKAHSQVHLAGGNCSWQ